MWSNSNNSHVFNSTKAMYLIHKQGIYENFILLCFAPLYFVYQFIWILLNYNLIKAAYPFGPTQPQNYI